MDLRESPSGAPFIGINVGDVLTWDGTEWVSEPVPSPPPPTSVINLIHEEDTGGLGPGGTVDLGPFDLTSGTLPLVVVGEVVDTGVDVTETWSAGPPSGGVITWVYKRLAGDPPTRLYISFTNTGGTLTTTWRWALFAVTWSP